MKMKRKPIPPEVWVTIAGFYAIGGWIGGIPGHDQSTWETAIEYAQVAAVGAFFAYGAWKIFAREYWESGWTPKKEDAESQTPSTTDGMHNQTTSSADGA